MKKLSTTFLSYQNHRQQAGASLLVVLMVLVIVSMLGLAATQIAIQGERAGRNDRDRQIAMQAAEAALLDAEFDIEGTSTAAAGKTKNDRSDVFQGQFSAAFVSGCGTSGNNQGLCTEAAAGSKPAWLSINLADASDTHGVPFGTFTGRSFPAGTEGIAPARLPRYIIENIPDYGNKDASSANTRAYRITAVGFGPRDTTRVVLQSVYRK